MPLCFELEKNLLSLKFIWVQSAGSSEIESSNHNICCTHGILKILWKDLKFHAFSYDEVLGVDCRCLKTARLFHVGSAAQRGESTQSLRQCFLG